MAKIPIILEPGRADGKLIKTDSVYDDNQEKFLSDKITEIDDNHNTLNNTVNSLTDIVNNNKTDIENKLETEKNRATNAENNLRETINNITDINGNATTAELITVNTLSNSTVFNVQQALNELFKNATYAGIATPTTNPGTPNSPVFYIATTVGIYSNFDSIEVSKGETVILNWNNGAWTKSSFKPMTDFNSVFDAKGESLTDELTKLEKYKIALQILSNSVNSILQSLSQVQENIFALCDKDGNIALKYDNLGFDVAKISDHFFSLLNNYIDNKNFLQVIEVNEPGLFYVDAELNVGEKHDKTGTHAINLVEFINR